LVLALGTGGMLIGLARDAGHGALGTLESLCGSSSGDLLGVFCLHWKLLPGMHLGMVVGALAGACLWRLRSAKPWRGRLHQATKGLACSAWMMAGMAAASVAYPGLAGTARGPVAMLGWMLLGMFAGMFAGMLVGSMLDRLAHKALFRAGDALPGVRRVHAASDVTL
jgi:hypothetical protein